MPALWLRRAEQVRVTRPASEGWTLHCLALPLRHCRSHCCTLHTTHPHARQPLFLGAERHARGADLSLCLGTSLQITPACNLPLLTVKAGGWLGLLLFVHEGAGWSCTGVVRGMYLDRLAHRERKPSRLLQLASATLL